MDTCNAVKRLQEHPVPHSLHQKKADGVYCLEKLPAHNVQELPLPNSKEHNKKMGRGYIPLTGQWKASTEASTWRIGSVKRVENNY
jgi:hypothetical protein